MPISTPMLATASVFAASSSVTTASFTPAANGLLLAAVVGRQTSVPGFPTVTSAAVGFAPLADGTFDPGSGTRIRATLWGGLTGTSPSIMTVTGAGTGAGRVGVAVVQVASGFSGLPDNAGTGSDGSGDPAVVMTPTPGASSRLVGFLLGAATAAGSTPPSGWTELSDTSDGAGLSIAVMHAPGTVGASVAFSSSFNATVALVTEIVALNAKILALPRLHHRRFAPLLIR